MAASYIIRYCPDGGEWQEVPLSKDIFILGRASTCDLLLLDSEVSRQHAQISLVHGQLYLTDLASRNGVWLEAKRIPSQQGTLIRTGQSFRIGKFTLSLDLPQPSLADSQIAQPISRTPYVLCYRQGDADWQELPIQTKGLVIGRAVDCDLQLDYAEISRHHARLNLKPDGIWLTDLGSTNGTQVDDRPLPPRKPTLLRIGQAFSLGGFNLQVDARPTGAAIPQPGAAPRSPEKTFIAPHIMRQATAPYALDLGAFGHVAIGRAPDNDLILNHPVVSCYHAEIERLGTRFRLRDLRSTNGVFVNGQRVEREIWLKDQDTIQIGPYILNLAGQDLRSRAETGLRLQASYLNQRVSRRLNLLQNLNLSIQPMEFVAVVGMSGSGKSTLLNALSGYRPASDGQVLVNGVDLYRHYDAFRNDMGYVPQRDIVHAELTPRSALEYVARLRMPPDTSAEERAHAVLEVLADLDLIERKDVPIGRLSGGQLKRVSIGVELLTKPRLFFLDEPTSGLDPGTEYEMMRLLRRLADQGRTVVLVTHATKNVNLCDKVIFLARGGHLAFFGPPEEALSYFDTFRSPRERQQKEMEFDDIYRILNDESRGAPPEWGQRFKDSPYYSAYCTQPAARDRPPELSAAPSAAAPHPTGLPKRRSRASAARQFWILSDRNIKILLQDKISLALMLALAPGIGLLDFIWGTHLFDPVRGDAPKVIMMWFMAAIVTVLLGSLSSVREIVKEADIYKRERAVNLQVLPYILSKVWVGVVLALYQAGVMLLARIVFVRLQLPDVGAYLALYLTMFLGTLCGYLIGLMISASAPNQNAAMLLIIAVLIPQFLFAGALLPLNLIPGGEAISQIMPTRWEFEALIRVTGLGDRLAADPCWQLPASERKHLSEAQELTCACLGINIFSQCANFPGILSPDYYDPVAQRQLAQPQPQEPPLPTPYPYPTAYPSPTPLPTPTLLPSPTAYPTPPDPRELLAYMNQRQAQGQAYQDEILQQFAQYRLDSQAQGAAYAEQRTSQGDAYAALRQAQGDAYREAMRAYGDQRAQWQESREKAISSAEALLETAYDNYGRAFRGSAFQRWVALLAIMAGLVILIVFFQRRKDVV